VDPDLALWYREYLYRDRFKMTHEEYLNEPAESVTWMNHIERTIPRDDG
jgi:hypothetical protein